MHRFQHPTSARRGWPLLRSLTIALAVALSAAITASPSAADTPTKYDVTFTTGGVMNDVCSYPVNIEGTFSGTYTGFVDKSGVLTMATLHGTAQDTFTANGKTLVGLPYRQNLQAFYDSQGNMTSFYENGVAEKVPLPDGSLFISAGRLNFLNHSGFVLSPDKGNPGDVAGFCAALAP